LFETRGAFETGKLTSFSKNLIELDGDEESNQKFAGFRYTPTRHE